MLRDRCNWRCVLRFENNGAKFQRIKQTEAGELQFPPTKCHIPLDLVLEPCNNLQGPTGRVWGCVSLAEVRIQEGESLENALRRFKRKVQQEDIIKEVKRHSFYLKPGEKKRVKEALARKRSRKKARKEQD
jgi:small subunit ribosomal protein S21